VKEFYIYSLKEGEVVSVSETPPKEHISQIASMAAEAVSTCARKSETSYAVKFVFCN
jgi:hypothetical protein